MPVIDARSLDGDSVTTSCDVAIVGAGAAGLFLANCLIRKGLSVVVLEAGGRIAEAGASIGFETAGDGTPYRGTDEGRAFGLGGTTAKWGGLLAPHTDFDIRDARLGDFDIWHHIVSVVRERSGEVLRILHLDSAIQENQTELAREALGRSLESLRENGLEVMIPEYMPFRKKNLSYLLEHGSGRERLTVFLHAVAADWEIHAEPAGLSRIQSLQARTDSTSLTITAERFVLAAGAIESARILLEMERRLDEAPFRPGAAVGRYLGDHLSCPIARVSPVHRTRTAELFGPRFKSGRMVGFRFVERTASDDRARGFSHFIFDRDDAGFGLAKDILQNLQAREVPELSLAGLGRAVSGLFRMGWDRYVHSRLFIPEDTPVHLQLDIEQRPDPRNCVCLSDEVDRWGRWKPEVRWQVREQDYRSLRRSARAVLDRWPGQEDGFPKLDPIREPIEERKPHDAYHPVGVCRMGTDSEAVVGPDLRVRGVTNLTVLSTGVFPSAGTANPTFSMLCLGAALAERIGSEL